MNCGEYKIDIGCGNDKSKGFIGIDLSQGSDADVVRDVTNGLPFCDNSAIEMRAMSVLEHFSNDDFIKLMWEIYRVLKNGCTISVLVPDSMTEVSFKDPTHKMHFTKETFSYFEAGSPKQKLYGLPPFKVEGGDRIGNGELSFKLTAIK